VEPPPESAGPPVGLDVLEAIATTRAVRRISPEAVSDDDLATILFAATRAPSGSNRQPFRFLVLRDGPDAAEAKSLLARGFRSGWSAKRSSDGYDTAEADPTSRKARMARTMQEFVDTFEDIPVVVLPCLVRYREPSSYEGASIYPACQNLLLAARARGLGGVMTEWHVLVEDELRALLGIPDGVFIAATIPLGHPRGGHGPVRRRPLSEFVFDGRWGEPVRWLPDPETNAR
jgi:nitroreductase